VYPNHSKDPSSAYLLTTMQSYPAGNRHGQLSLEHMVYYTISSSNYAFYFIAAIMPFIL
jgi:hypothetical protein